MNNDTLLIDITDRKAVGFLQELAALQWIRVIKPDKQSQSKLSDKYRGSLSLEQGQSLQAHIRNMRNEWNAI